MSTTTEEAVSHVASVAAARALLDPSGDGRVRGATWHWDLASGWLEWDEGLKAHFGHEDRVTDAAWREDRIHPEDRARVLASLQRATIAHPGAVWSDKHRFRQADGSFAAVTERACIIHDDAGPRGVLGAITPASVVVGAKETGTEEVL